MHGYVYQINCSKGGVPKLPVSEVNITLDGLLGDYQRDKRYHGGPDRAVSLFSYQLIQKLQEEGHPIYPGSTGENLTLWFEDFHLLQPGVKLKLGEVILQVTSYAAPCKTIRESFTEENFKRISQKLYPGESRLYCKVIQEGWVAVNDGVEIIDYP